MTTKSEKILVFSNAASRLTISHCFFYSTFLQHGCQLLTPPRNSFLSSSNPTPFCFVHHSFSVFLMGSPFSSPFSSLLGLDMSQGSSSVSLLLFLGHLYTPSLTTAITMGPISIVLFFVCLYYVYAISFLTCPLKDLL